MVDAPVDVNRPDPVATELPYEPPPTGQNPVVRGTLLTVLAEVVSHVSWLQRILWSNAGFSKLRNRPELAEIEPRYDPTVIIDAATAVPAGEDGGDGDGDGYATLFKALKDEDWSAKRPPSSIFPSFLDYRDAYEVGKLTPSAVVEALLPLVSRDEEPRSHHSTAFTETKSESVREAATASTKRWAAGAPLSPVDGVPFVVKDNIDVAGYHKYQGTRIDFTKGGDRTSWCVQRLLDAGAILIGKSSMHEIGLDTNGNNPIWGTPLNPYNEQYYCGGSSSGSAYALASGLTPFAHGADGGGSIRIPSGFCGLYGLKTSHGRVSRHPMPSGEKSTTVEGPMAANMVDLEICYRIMAQPNRSDATSRLFSPPRPIIPPPDRTTRRPKVLGIYHQWIDRASGPVRKLYWNMVDHFTTSLGYSTVDITIPLLHDGQMAHAMTILTEVVSLISPIDFVRLSGAGKMLVMVGSQSMAVDLLQAQKLRHLLLQHLSYLFTAHPGLIVLTPTTPTGNWRIAAGAKDLSNGCSDGNSSVRSMEYVWLANFCGCPAINVPAGYVEPEPRGEDDGGKVPVGIMGMGQWCSEDDLIEFGYDAERWLEGKGGGGRLKPPGLVDVMALATENV